MKDELSFITLGIDWSTGWLHPKRQNPNSLWANATWHHE